MRYGYKQYCKDFENIENYQKAKADNFKGWDCHHRLETWTSDGERRAVDITAAELIALGMYYNRPASELIFLRKCEHTALRKVSSATRKKISEAKKGKPKSEETKKKLSVANKGKHHSEETRRKISEAARNMSAETRKKMSEAHKGKPGGMKGKHHSEESRKKLGAANRETRWYNNGEINIRAKMCPKGFVPGRISWKK